MPPRSPPLLDSGIAAATCWAAAFMIAAAGVLVLTQLRPTSPPLVVIIGSGMLAFGLAMILTLVTELVPGKVAPERASAASALIETCSEFGGALGIAVLGIAVLGIAVLGIAVLGSIGAAVYASRISAHLRSGPSANDARRTPPPRRAVAISAHLPIHPTTVTLLRRAASISRPTSSTD